MVDVLVAELGKIKTDANILLELYKIWTPERCKIPREPLDVKICSNPGYLPELINKLQNWLIYYQRLFLTHTLPSGDFYTSFIMEVAQDFVDLSSILENLTLISLPKGVREEVDRVLENMLGCATEVGGFVIKLFSSIKRTDIVNFLAHVCQRLTQHLTMVGGLPSAPTGFGPRSCERCDEGVRVRGTTYVPTTEILQSWSREELEKREALLKNDLIACNECSGGCKVGRDCGYPYQVNYPIYDKTMERARAGLERIRLEKIRRQNIALARGY